MPGGDEESTEVSYCETVKPGELSASVLEVLVRH